MCLYTPTCTKHTCRTNLLCGSVVTEQDLCPKSFYNLVMTDCAFSSGYKSESPKFGLFPYESFNQQYLNFYLVAFPVPTVDIPFKGHIPQLLCGLYSV